MQNQNTHGRASPALSSFAALMLKPRRGGLQVQDGASRTSS
jgi:hypothetical protein